MSGFTELNLCPELNATLEALGYREPTPIQSQAIPLVLAGHDLIAEAQTGTGKTASFALPMIERLSKTPVAADYHAIRGLVLVPTRELAIQVGDNTLEYGQLLGMRVISIFGGVRFDNQLRKMKRGADILVATPGRLLDMLKQKKLTLEQLEILVFDEADRMLDLGFINEIKALLAYMPERKQTLLFSATLDESVEVLADKLLDNPKRVSVAKRNAPASQVTQRAYAVDNRDKADVLAYLITGAHWQQTLVFTRTKRRADELAASLQHEGIDALAIHGDKHQKERIATLNAFANGEVNVLVATDVAARGLDIESLPQVVNYDLPNQPQDYVHRIGRTGRAGQKGLAVSLVAPEERRFLNAISELINKPLQLQPVPVAENGKLTDGKALADNSKRKPTAGGHSAKGGAKSGAKPQPQARSKAPSRTAKSEPEPNVPARSAGRRSLFSK
ncbi:ATP-dependent RNA helicase RhlE [Marinobacterium lacunae]|uniref:ATP-dependent RNA helicase RhlE n=1 Tax=Marinobacterium lacunae TaxID=1232683 RepID=A0A081G1Y9_9GAMM|nr:DEAD/DEAH box helicase [Marinobacterium lacunae]KEA64794.1 ATP-dependent RNA helicase RhlE [Marinobacterium lacunae]